MQVDEALTARANQDAALVAIFGDNVHWVQRPQGQMLPALILQIISEQRPKDLDGFSGMRTARVQADSMALTFAEARDGIEAAIAALLPESTVNGDNGSVVFWEGDVDGPRDLGEQPDSGPFIHRASADLIIRYAMKT